MKQGVDQRPKIISFHESLDGIQIAARKDLIWPCAGYRVALPIKPESDLNVIEQLVLKLAECGVADTSELVDKTGFHKEFVHLVQSRLNHLGYLDERHSIDRRGKELLDKLKNQEFEYASATIYRDLVSGQLLPIVNSNAPEFMHVSDLKGDDRVRFKKGTAGNAKEIMAHKVSCSSNLHQVPESREVVGVIKQYLKLCSQRTRLSCDYAGMTSLVPQLDAITVNPASEIYYLHVKAFVQAGFSDVVITDGFGLSFSPIFSQALSRQSFPWLISLKEQAGKTLVSRGKSSVQTDEDVVLKSYPVLKRLVQKIREQFGNLEVVKVDSTHKEKDYQNSVAKILKALYDTVEYALMQVNRNYLISNWKEHFPHYSDHENNNNLHGYAVGLGFESGKLVKKLLRVQRGKLNRAGKKDPELQPELALAIASARGNMNHPLRKLAQHDRYAISFLADLKAKRDKVSHGDQTAVAALKVEEIDSIRYRVYRIIATLLPDIVEFDGASSVCRTRANDADQEMLAASIRLDKMLGTITMMRVDSDLKDELMRMELLAPVAQNPGDRVGCAPWVNSVASVLQILSYHLLKSEGRSTAENLGLTGLDIRDTGIARIKEAGFTLRNASVQPAISKVNPGRVKRASQGINATLGANLLALLSLSDDSFVAMLANRCPAMIMTISQLLELRGHGNSMQIDIGFDEFTELREHTYEVLKVLLEISH